MDYPARLTGSRRLSGNWRTTPACFFLCWLCVVALDARAVLHFTCPTDRERAVEGSADLDRLLALHDYVFMARVDAVRRPGVLADAEVRDSVELFVYQPPLKGAVPEVLRFNRDGPCAPDFSEGAVHLVFSNDLKKAPLRTELRTVLAYESGPAVQWIVDWVQAQHRAQPMLGSLEELTWEYRVLLVDARRMSLDVLSILRRRAEEILERQLVWWVITDEGLETNFNGRVAPELVSELQRGNPPAKARVSLVGKDGGVKLEAGFLDLDRVFARIDSMPMRAREMRETPH